MVVRRHHHELLADPLPLGELGEREPRTTHASRGRRLLGGEGGGFSPSERTTLSIRRVEPARAAAARTRRPFQRTRST
jgi:hypothetical protein